MLLPVGGLLNLPLSPAVYRPSWMHVCSIKYNWLIRSQILHTTHELTNTSSRLASITQYKTAET